MTSVLGGGSNAAQATALGSLQFQTSQAGGVIPLVWGTTRVAVNLLDYQDFTATPAGKGKGGGGGKGGGAGKSGGQYNYSASIVLGICQGGANAFGLIWYDKNISPLPSLPGISFIATGADGQAADPYWITNHMPNALGYSGNCWFSADNYKLGMSAALPNFSVEVSGPESGTAANQGDANPADIVIDFLTNPRYGAGFPLANLDVAGALADYRGYCDSAGIFLAPMIDQQSEAQQFLADIARITNSAIVWSGSLLKLVPYGDQPLAISYVLVDVGGDVVELDTLSLTFAAAGLPGSPRTVSYQAQPADVNTDTSNFSSVCAGLAQAVDNDHTLGDFGITAGIGLSAVVVMLRGSAFATPVTVTASGGGVEVFQIVPRGPYTWNPVTQVVYQLGEDDLIVQASSAGGASGPNPGGAALRQGAGPITGGFNRDPVAVTRSSPADAMNYVQLECLDRAHSYNTEIVEKFDQASVDLYGVRKDTSLKAHAIVDFIGVGPIVAALVLQRDLLYRNTYSFQLGWKYCLLEPMDLVQINDPRCGISNLTVRITSIIEDEEGTLAVTAEDFFGTPGAVLYPPAKPIPVAPGVSSLGQGGGTAVYRPVQGKGAAAYVPNWANPAPAVNPPFIFEAPPALLTAQGIAGPQLIVGLSGTPANSNAVWNGAAVFVSLDNESYGYQGEAEGASAMGLTTSDLAASSDSLAVDLSQSDGKLAGVSAQAAALGVSLCAVRYPGAPLELLSFTTATLTGPGQYVLVGLHRGLYGTQAIPIQKGAQFLYLGAGIYYAQAMPAQYVGVPLWFKFPSINLVGGGQQSQDAAIAWNYVPTGGAAQVFARGTPLAAEVRSSAVRVDPGLPVESR